PRCLPMRDGTIGFGVQVASLFWFVEFGGNRATRRAVVFQPTEEICSAGCLTDPALWSEMWSESLQVEPIAAGRDKLVSLDRYFCRVPGDVEVRAGRGLPCDIRVRGPQRNRCIPFVQP